MAKIILAGFKGSMGQKALKMIADTPEFDLVGVYSPSADQGAASYGLAEDVAVFNQLDQIKLDADIWLDFTTPSAVYQNTRFAIEHGLHPVVGTTGLSDGQEQELIEMSQKQGLGGLIAPNFGLSAVLLMQFAQKAAQYFPDVEIIEMHHEDKKDAPSGTALMTAKMIDEVRPEHEQGHSKETLAGVRGGDYHGIRVHAVRLPGYIAHEEVLFGGPGEGLTIRQDSFDRASFMQGVKLAINKVDQLDQLTIGLEKIL
ncbi:4-hydroxy-tetrahydrodipicolinate reductase [Convivina praedatoris]|uniref:4-hydroxy-tetrahydrodipicolinate reductase n=1 Tax=Convivina praedatoris TaxID=2880963 RepID=A0ABN8H8F2_9LACO|nr:4-hydroxy-tetrahydrodipicolinate reductase [Convivina sp. LMG 32447]CAH1852122.1 4-hydroxy-tetrahydrodipicolinate reductase [Convivina sp. LMG 32447]CAH1852150.1 4-hydroxy-tetrahydrodipicolinate reductase [Convivina sp. LMG 32447]CAH1852786.1 4-hydroxy-tetrahydrodipicolinate reductase [Convivina sp. LMG 32447]